MERTDITAWLAMVPDPSEMSRTGSVLRILDISDGSDRGQPEAVKLESAGSASHPFCRAISSVEVR